ncbi:MAG: VWA domain-containing protein, partial [Mycobacteriaceae bacterium]
NAFASFLDSYSTTLTTRSSLLILGDGRNNYRDANLAALTEMVSAVKHAHWLNPEPIAHWGAGDSAALRYSEAITMHECRSAGQLADVVSGLLPV